MKMATVTVVVTAKGDMTVKMPKTTTTQHSDYIKTSLRLNLLYMSSRLRSRRSKKACPILFTSKKSTPKSSPTYS